ncbi:hypothetical protein ABBQ38_007743 [Trebouxia sp. C0009 RCD-2024]
MDLQKEKGKQRLAGGSCFSAACIRLTRFKYVAKQGGKYSTSVPNGKGVQVHIGSYQTEEEAAKAVDVIRLFLHQEPVNFVADEYDATHIRASASSLNELVASMRPIQKKPPSSRFKYVSGRKNGTYMAQLQKGKGRALHIGMFKTEEEAARAIDVASVFLNEEPVNFGADDYDSEHIRASASSLTELIDGLNTTKRKAKASRFKHVVEQDGKYRAVVPNGKGGHFQTRGHQTEEEAAKAVDVIRLFLHQEPVNFVAEEYDIAHIAASASSLKELIDGFRFKYVSRQDGKYKASVPDGKGARVRVGGYQTEEEAGKAVDVIRVFLHQEPINFVAEEYDSAHIKASASSLDELVASMRAVSQKSSSSRFKYVNRMKNGTYRALIAEGKGRALYIGHFKTEEEAPELLMSQDCFCLVQNQEPVNYGADEYDSAHIRASASSLDELVASMRPVPKRSTRFKYVNLMKNGTYKALLTQSKGRALYIGLFKTEEEAARAVDVTRVFLNKEPVNFGADEYDSAHIRASASSLTELIASIRDRKQNRDKAINDAVA